MANTTTPSYQALYDSYAAAGQSHVFTFWDQISADEQARLLDQLSTIDPRRVNDVYKLAVAHDAVDGGGSAQGSTGSTIAPPPAHLVDTTIDNPAAEKEWRQEGLAAMQQGKVGIILLAGGQGTRLGSSDPKGCYDIGLPSGKSLFQLQAERIKRLQTLTSSSSGTGKAMPWYIMTSGPTRKATEAFFKKHNYFGLDERDVIFFNQGGSAIFGQARATRS